MNKGIGYVLGFAKALLRPLYKELQLIKAFWRDYLLYRLGSNFGGRNKNKNKLFFEIRRVRHSFEKGMALPNPRKKFGSNNMTHLVKLLEDDKSPLGKCHDKEIAKGIIDAYQQFSASMENKTSVSAANTVFLRSELEKYTEDHFSNFLQNRHSIRQFSKEKITHDEVIKVIDSARHAPSVCNRQTTRVIFVAETDKIQKIMSLHKGNRGFGHQIPGVFVVVSDLYGFVSTEERNQCWIDGGLFSMYLGLSLSANGFGHCMLNWSSDIRSDKQLIKLLGLSESMRIIMLIAFGRVPEKQLVARSTKRLVSQILTSI